MPSGTLKSEPCWLTRFRHFAADHMPYGGVKDSGIGREGVQAAIEDMTEPRMLVLNLKPPAGN